MWGYWRRRLAEDLDLPPTATWYAVEHALIEHRAAAAEARAAAADAIARTEAAQRDRGEMQAFLTQCALYWWEAGRAGEDGPS